MRNKNAISAKDAERFILTANFDRLIRIQEIVSAEVTGRNQEGVLLQLEMGIPALAPLPIWCDLTVETGTQVTVQVHSITDQMQVHCRLLRILDSPNREQ